jgi:hypothetical protein
MGKHLTPLRAIFLMDEHFGKSTQGKGPTKVEDPVLQAIFQRFAGDYV